MRNLKEILEELDKECRLFSSLMIKPEYGLSTWNKMAQDRCKKIHRLIEETGINKSQPKKTTKSTDIIDVIDKDGNRV